MRAIRDQLLDGILIDIAIAIAVAFAFTGFIGSSVRDPLGPSIAPFVASLTNDPSIIGRNFTSARGVYTLDFVNSLISFVIVTTVAAALYVAVSHARRRRRFSRRNTLSGDRRRARQGRTRLPEHEQPSS